MSVARRPATMADLRSFAWFELRYEPDWIDRLRILRELAALDAAESGDDRAGRIGRRLTSLYVESSPEGRRLVRLEVTA